MQIAAGLDAVRRQYPEKFASESEIFRRIFPGARIFIGTGCGEPQYLVQALIRYVESNPKAFFDTEVLHLWTLGVAPYTNSKYTSNFRLNSFFVGGDTRVAVNRGLADYTPIFLSQVPALFRRDMVPVDIALVQTTPPDIHGYMSLGVSVDIVKAALSQAQLIVAQINNNMPRVHGDSFIHIKDVSYLVPHDEPLLEYGENMESPIVQRIGNYVARLIQDGDTIQVGYGALPNAILANLREKKHLGVHTELLSDGIIDLMKLGVIDNSQKTLNRGKTIASFCMAKKDTYEYIHDNPAVELRTIDYTNNPLIISQHTGMTAINSALEVDMTGQASAESIGNLFYSGIGGQADFMRGAVMAANGKAILALQSTAQDDQISRIVPFLREGTGTTLNRGDVRYVVTEYGIAYLHGKNIRERAMALISIAHPKFREQLLEEAKNRLIVYADQKIITGKGGEYPEELEARRVTFKGLQIFIRPVRITDEPILKDFFYSLSESSLYRRFISTRRDMPHDRLQPFVIVDYTRETTLLAVIEHEEREEVVGAAWLYPNEKTHTAEVAFATKDAYQDRGIGTTLLARLVYLARRQGLLALVGETLTENVPMRHIFERVGFKTANSSPDTLEMKLVL